MLFGSNDVRNLKIEVVDNAGQMIQAGTIVALDDVILLSGPIELYVATNQIGNR